MFLSKLQSVFVWIKQCICQNVFTSECNVSQEIPTSCRILFYVKQVNANKGKPKTQISKFDKKLEHKLFSQILQGQWKFSKKKLVKFVPKHGSASQQTFRKIFNIRWSRYTGKFASRDLLLMELANHECGSAILPSRGNGLIMWG